MSIELINTKHFVATAPPPEEADIVFASVNAKGKLDDRSQFLLSRLDYPPDSLPDANDLLWGCSELKNDGNKKPVMAVLTAGDRDTSYLLAENLYKALEETLDKYPGKSIWIPLMRTITGNLSTKESFNITARVINSLTAKRSIHPTITIAIPDDLNGFLFTEAYALLEAAKRKDTVNILAHFYTSFYFIDASRMHQDFLSIGVDFKKNDILISVSWAFDEVSTYDIIKAIGIVKSNPKDNKNDSNLEVEWIITDLEIEIQSISQTYNPQSVIAKGNFEDALKIFNLIDPKLWVHQLINYFISPEYSTSSPALTSKIAGIISDTEKGIDYLNISKDVYAFSRVIAAKSYDPPLAIALLGKWGSGKSFFMRKLKETIIDLSASKSDDQYCKGIAHIHFNAWSYTDANLWASIVTRIFEGLNEYISENGKPREEEKIKEKLSKDLTIVKKEVLTLESNKSAIENQVKELEKKKSQATNALNDRIKEIKNKNLWDTIKNIDEQFDAKTKIIKACEENPTYRVTREELKEIIPEQYWSDPEATYKQIKSKYTFLKVFFRKDKIYKNLFWLGLILILISLLFKAIEYIPQTIFDTNFLLSKTILSLLATAGLIWRNIEKSYKQLQPIVSSFWKIKDEYEEQIQQATASFEQDQKALLLEIEKKELEITAIDTQIYKGKTEISDLEFRINHALATESLYSFIDRRSKSDDYKKHLGIISYIRKDFETLSELFVGHHEEVIKGNEIKQFREKFKKPLERVILYIDDLDRCSEENVVQVLEAVNLLMAFPLFIVIVGVDYQWVRKALTQKHHQQFKQHDGIDILDPSDYLEKIFQIPFQLKEADETDIKSMIRQLANFKPYIKKPDIEIPSGLLGNVISLSRAKARIVTADEPLTVDLKDKATITPLSDIDLLEFSEEEVQIMEDMSIIIGNNPRAIKRFVNIFRIIKAHGEYLTPSGTAKKELYATIFMLALPLGRFKKLVRSFEMHLYNNTDQLITHYFKTTNGSTDHNDHLKIALLDIFRSHQKFEMMLNTHGEVFLKHLKLIKRFSFNT